MIRTTRSDNDLLACAHIWLEASRLAHAFIPARFWADNFAAMRDEYLPASTVHAYYVDDAPVAFAAVRDNTLHALFCSPRFCSQGIGGQLAAFLQGEYESLTLAVYAKNTGAIRFYERHGFVKITSRVCGHTGEEEYEMRWERG